MRWMLKHPFSQRPYYIVPDLKNQAKNLPIFGLYNGLSVDYFLKNAIII